jgi:hypothetical protein
MEKYTDLCGGWNGVLRIKVMTPLDRCAAAFDSFITPPPPSPSVTPTVTPSPTCPIITQYLEVITFENTKFRMSLWNNPDYTSNAEAVCDYIISGTAYGSLGTIYTGTEPIPAGEHTVQFNLQGVLLPGEVVSSFEVHSYTLDGCICPINLILP